MISRKNMKECRMYWNVAVKKQQDSTNNSALQRQAGRGLPLRQAIWVNGEKNSTAREQVHLRGEDTEAKPEPLSPPRHKRWPKPSSNEMCKMRERLWNLKLNYVVIVIITPMRVSWHRRTLKGFEWYVEHKWAIHMSVAEDFSFMETAKIEDEWWNRWMPSVNYLSGIEWMFKAWMCGVRWIYRNIMVSSNWKESYHMVKATPTSLNDRRRDEEFCFGYTSRSNRWMRREWKRSSHWSIQWFMLNPSTWKVFSNQQAKYNYFIVSLNIFFSKGTDETFNSIK